MQELAVDTKPLLRPEQLQSALAEKQSLEAKLASPHIQSKGEVAKQLRRLDTQLREQTPIAFQGKEKDAAVRLEQELREAILQGMPSQEEMRKNPHGAVDKHMDWDRRNKDRLLMWKNVQLRLNAGSPDTSVANFEKFRPRASTLNMDGAQVSGAQHFLPPAGAAPSVVLSQAQLEMIGQVDPELLGQMALLTNEQRAAVKDVISKALDKADSEE